MATNGMSDDGGGKVESAIGVGGVRGKAAAMLGMPMPGMMGGGVRGGVGIGVGGGSVLNGGSQVGFGVGGGSGTGGSSTPDLFSYTFAVEMKGAVVNVEVGASAVMSEVYEKAVAGMGEKVKKEALERQLYYKESGIYVPLARRADSLLWNGMAEMGEVIELEMKKKDSKKMTPLVIQIPPFVPETGNSSSPAPATSTTTTTETVEVNSNTTVMGVIQLLPRRNSDDESCTLWSKKGKLDWNVKVTSVIKKEEAFECKIDSELKALGGGIAIFSQQQKSSSSSASSMKKKENRKSVLPSSSSSSSISAGKRPITPSSSSSSVNGSSSSASKKDLERLLTNRPSEADLKKKNIIVDFKSDVKASAPMAVDPNSALPLSLSIFKQLGAFIKQHLTLVGLFRVSGDVEEVKTFYQGFWGGKVKWDGGVAQNDPHVATSALKLYLRKQPDPLIPFSLYQEFITAQKIEDESTQLSAIKIAIGKMPEPNAQILHYLIHTLTLVASQEDANKMNPINIGIVFGPTIMWDPKPNVMDYSSTGYQSSLVTNMIDHYASLWTSPPPSDESDDTVTTATGGVSKSQSSSNLSGHSPSSPSVLLDSSPDSPSQPVTGGGLARPPSISGRPAPGMAWTPPPGSGAPPPGSVAPKRGPPKLPPTGPPPMAPSASGGNISVGGAGGLTTPGASTPGTSSPANISPSPSSDGLLPTRTSFRKSLPPNMIPPATPLAPPTAADPGAGSSFTPSSSLSSIPELAGAGAQGEGAPTASFGGGLGSGPASPQQQHVRKHSASSSPPRRPVSMASIAKFDSQLAAVEQEIRDAAIGSEGTTGAFSFPTIASLNLDEVQSHFLASPSSEATKHLIAILAALKSRH